MRAGVETPPPKRRRRSSRTGSQHAKNKSREPLSARLDRFVTLALSLLLVGGLLVGGLLLGAYALGRKQREAESLAGDFPVSEGVSRAGPSIAPSDLATFDTVLEFLTTGKLAEARHTLVQAREAKPDLPFSEYLLGKILLLSKNAPEGVIHLNSSANRGEMAPESLLELAQAYARVSTRPEVVERYYEQAILADPLNPDPFFYYGQALRKVGQSSKAVEALQRAVLRAKGTSDEPIIAGKLALARLENGDPTIAAELRKPMAEGTMDVPKIFAAAALAAREQDFAQAAELIRQARELAPPEVFRYLLSDQIFEASRGRPEMRDLLNPR